MFLQGSSSASKENAVAVIQWILPRTVRHPDCIWPCSLGAEGWHKVQILEFSSKWRFFWSLMEDCSWDYVTCFRDLSPAIHAEQRIKSRSLRWLIIGMETTLQTQLNQNHCVITWTLARFAAKTLSKCTACEQDQPESLRLWWKLNIEQRLVWISSQKHTFH